MAFPNEVPLKGGPAIINALLVVAPPDLRIGILTLAIHGDRSWIKRTEEIMGREIRIRGLRNKAKN